MLVSSSTQEYFLGELVRKVGSAEAGRLLPWIAYPDLRGPLKGARFVLGSLAG